jgi:dTDP-4-amino-4,6-dideoxygalactose transaminase
MKAVPLQVATEAAKIEFIDLIAQRRRMGDRIDAAIRRVVDSGRYIMGPEVAEIERALSSFCGARHVVTCSSGTDALMLCLRAKGVGPGQAVLLPSFTFAATAEVICHVGATPVFVDSLPDTFNIDPESVRQGIAAARRMGLNPAAVVAVDLFGQPADYDALEPVIAEHDLWLLDDAAQSFGANFRGRHVGALAPLTATSFYPSKPLGCYGDGGAVFTQDPDLADLLVSLRMHGKGQQKYDHVRVGMNARFDTIQAAILLEKLRIFPEELQARTRIARRYNDLLQDLVRVPSLISGVSSVWAQYAILTPHRDQIVADLAAAGVPTAIHYPIPLHRQSAYVHYPIAGNGLPVAERLSAEVLSLPMHAYLDEATQDRIVDAVRDSVRRQMPRAAQ